MYTTYQIRSSRDTLRRIIPLAFVLALLFIMHPGMGQSNEKQGMFRDTLDGKFDASKFLIEADGFLPLVQLITEPALGNIGVMVAPVFIKPNKYQKEGEYVPPNVTSAFAGYTANKTWLVGALRRASLPKVGMKYRVGVGYGSVNLDYYRDIQGIGEQKFGFNFKVTTIFGSILKEIGQTDLFVGVEYLFLKNNVSPRFDFDELPDFVDEASFKAVQSSPGLILEYDKRDNIFTPDKGTLISSDFRVNANWTGSDFEFKNWRFSILQYFQPLDNWVAGFRLETQQQFGDAPFYLLRSLNMRGVPSARYQGNSTYLLETEQRYDFTLRWSGVLIGGVAKAFERSKTDFSDAEWVYNYGFGFRYLIARAFNLRMGVDVAWSNEDFGYYIVFGSAW